MAQESPLRSRSALISDRVSPYHRFAGRSGRRRPSLRTVIAASFLLRQFLLYWTLSYDGGTQNPQNFR